MNNVIVYSFHFESGNPNDTSHFGQIRHSIYTLRQHNKDIPIKVFISPIDAYSKMSIDLYDAEVISFDASTDTLLDSIEMATRRKHRWPNVFSLLENGYDNVLYVDPDTIWQGNVQEIFDKYSGSMIYSKEDHWEEFSDYLTLTTPTMNEGVMLIPKSTLAYKDHLLSQVELTMIKWQEELRPTLEKNDHLWYAGVQWAACQYALSEFLADIGQPFIEFDKMDVAIIHEYREMSEEDKKRVTVLHYLSQNYSDFVPYSFLDYMEKINV